MVGAALRAEAQPYNLAQVTSILYTGGMSESSPTWCLICEQRPATGMLLRYKDGKPLARPPGASSVDVCRECGVEQTKDSTGAALRFTPYLRPPQSVKLPPRRRPSK